MIIYKDILTGDEMFTDSNKVTLVDDCLYEVLCHHVSRKQGDIALEGANPSAEGEDGDCGTDVVVQSGLDLVLNQNLKPTSFDKKAYMNYLRSYTKTLMEKWKNMEISPEQMEDNKDKMAKAAKLVLPKLADAEFFTGESGDPDGMVCILEYRDKPDGSGEDALMLFFKCGLMAEKV